MTSEIRVNKLTNRVGLGTVEYTNTGIVVSGISTSDNFKTGTSNLHSTGLNIFDLDVDGHTNLDNGNVAGIVTFNSGAALHTNGGQILLYDRPDGNSNNLFFGTGGKAVAYHDGTGFSIVNNTGHAYIGVGAGSKDLYLYAQASGNVLLQQNTGVRYVKGVGSDASVQLFFNNNLRLNTTTAGVSIPKDLDVDGHTNLDNVSIAGVSTFSGVVRVPNGSAGAPAIHFGDSDSGVYGDASNGVRLTAGGSDTIVATTNGVTFPPKATALTSFTLGSQSAHTKPLYFADANGVQSASILLDNSSQELRIKNGRFSGQITFTTYNTEKLRITSGGQVNIGGSTQTSKTLYVDGTIEATSNLTCVNQIYLSGTAPQLVFTDTNQDSDYTIKNDGGQLLFIDRTNSNATRMYANTGGFGGDRLYIANDIVHTGDTDTKIEFGTNTINFDTAGTERLHIASNGDIGLGTIPETDSYQPSLYFAGGNANIWGSGNANLYAAVNARYTGAGGWKYNNNGVASYVGQQSGVWNFFNAPSGTADNVATFFERFRINSDGEVRLHSANGNNSDTPGITFRGGNSTQKANFARIHSRMVSGWGGQLQFKVKDDTGSLSDAYQTAMIMDHNGAVTKPNTVAFRAIHNGNQSLSSGATITTWQTSNALRCHAQGGASISSGVFTAPVTGVYVFHAQFLLMGASSTTGIHLIWKKNNQTFTYFNSRYDGNQIGYGGYVPICGQTTMHLDANENCRIVISFGGNAPSVYGTDGNWGFWDGYLLG